MGYWQDRIRRLRNLKLAKPVSEKMVVSGDELQVGDVLNIYGRRRRITSINYEGPYLQVVVEHDGHRVQLDFLPFEAVCIDRTTGPRSLR